MNRCLAPIHRQFIVDVVYVVVNSLKCNKLYLISDFTKLIYYKNAENIISKIYLQGY